MQNTGEIFNPEYLILDPTTSIVYRKEQFPDSELYPHQLLVRDRRFLAQELIEMFRKEGISAVWTRHVRAGLWETDLPAAHEHAKEVLLLGERM